MPPENDQLTADARVFQRVADHVQTAIAAG